MYNFIRFYFYAINKWPSSWNWYILQLIIFCYFYCVANCRISYPSLSPMLWKLIWSCYRPWLEYSRSFYWRNVRNLSDLFQSNFLVLRFISQEPRVRFLAIMDQQKLFCRFLLHSWFTKFHLSISRSRFISYFEKFFVCISSCKIGYRDQRSSLIVVKTRKACL